MGNRLKARDGARSAIGLRPVRAALFALAPKVRTQQPNRFEEVVGERTRSVLVVVSFNDRREEDL